MCRVLSASGGRPEPEPAERSGARVCVLVGATAADWLIRFVGRAECNVIIHFRGGALIESGTGSHTQHTHTVTVQRSDWRAGRIAF